MWLLQLHYPNTTLFQWPWVDEHFWLQSPKGAWPLANDFQLHYLQKRMSIYPHLYLSVTGRMAFSQRSFDMDSVTPLFAILVVVCPVSDKNKDATSHSATFLTEYVVHSLYHWMTYSRRCSIKCSAWTDLEWSREYWCHKIQGSLSAMVPYSPYLLDISCLLVFCLHWTGSLPKILVPEGWKETLWWGV